jgi:orotate phosphoribosyltransferase
VTVPRDELHRLLAERAFRWGDFVLASGRRSDYFFDAKQVTLEGRGLFLAASLMLARCRELGVSAVAGDDGVGPLLGAIVALSAAGSDRPLRAFMIRKAQKEHGIAARIAGPAPAEGERVALVEDVVTSGGSALRALEVLAPTGVQGHGGRRPGRPRGGGGGSPARADTALARALPAQRVQHSQLRGR